MTSTRELRRRTNLNTSSDSTRTTISSPVRNRSVKGSPKKSPISGNQSLNSNKLDESIQDEDNINPNLSEDDSCDSSCDQDFTSDSPRNHKEFVTTSSPGKAVKLSSSIKQNVSLKPEPSSWTAEVWIVPFFVALIAGALAICLILTMFPFGPVMQESSSHIVTNSREIFETNLLREVKALQASYPTQDMKTWINFMAAITSISDSPAQPAVLLLVTHQLASAINTTNCIAKQLANVTNRLFNATTNHSVLVPKKELLSEYENKIKQELDDEIRSILSHSYAIVLDEIDKIPPKAVMVLHGYCDNFMAPFKQRVIILTAIANDEYPFNSDKVDSFLRKLWDSELGEDKSASLVSRVANMPVFIHSEEVLKNCGEMGH